MATKGRQEKGGRAAGATASREVGGVRITPPELRFVDSVPGGRYRAVLSVQNLQPSSCFLHMVPPERPQFKLIVENPKKPLASGLHLTASVEYHPDTEEDLQDRIILHAGEKIIEIPVIGLIPCCCLGVEPEVNFGTVIANNKVIGAEMRITNYGSFPGTFNIKYKGSVSILITPTSGVVEPQKKQLVKMEICTDVPRIINQPAIRATPQEDTGIHIVAEVSSLHVSFLYSFFHVAFMQSVELQGQPSAEIMIKANIVEQILEVLGVPYSNAIQCVDFGCIYFETSKTEDIILHNKSPEPMDWVAVLQDSTVGIELGTDIQKSTDAVLKDWHHIGGKPGLNASALIACIPNEGTLHPYQKIVVTLCFSPKQLKRDKDLQGMSSRQDYALFLKFEVVGSKDDFFKAVTEDYSSTSADNPHQFELGLTGSGLPVMLTVVPGPHINFRECYIGEHTDIVCILKNECDSLPVTFVFRKIAHYSICPEKGKLKAGSTQDVVFSFVPRHVGTFIVKQVVDIIGPVLEENNLPTLKMKSFHQIYLNFSGLCKSVTNKVVLKFNPGLTPFITNEMGVFVANKMEQHSDIPPVALLKSNQTQLHVHQINRNLDKAIMALPNDRPASLRPAELYKDYRTIFTKTPRYSYLDPEFSYTLYEELERQGAKDHYADYIKKLRQRRLHKKASRIFELLDNPVDIGLQPASGLKSPKIKVLQQAKLVKEDTCVHKSNLLTSRQLEETESKAVDKEVNELNPVPSSPQEIQDCSLTLTPKELHQIFIGPSTIDFGEVCVLSTSTRKMHIVNNLPVHVWIQVKIEIEELQQTSPLSHVMPPFTKTSIPVVFEDNKLGTFRKSFTYTINQHHTGYALVLAKIVPVALELSTRELTLNPTYSFLAESGFRSTVTLYNRKNYPAEFIWKPVMTAQGMPFYICPEKGIVEAYQDQECEVVWYPSFSAPTTGEFDLCVHQGKTLRLKCFAKFGPTTVQFKEQRITFNHAPLHLTTSRTAILQNLGYNHAYFQVLDTNPLPGMVITPLQGVVSVGSNTQLTIYFRPSGIMKFDSRVEVAVQNAKHLVLRIGGSVEVPDIDISVTSFNFTGVYVGSTQEIPFLIENKGKARAKVTADLSKHEAFQIHFSHYPDIYSESDIPHLYSAIIDGNSTLECSLNFTPTEVAAYDFNLPIDINVGEILTSPTKKRASHVGSVKHIIVPRPQPLNVPTQVCKVQATVLQPPLQVSPLDFTFQYSMRTINLGVVSDSNNIKKLYLNNISNKQLKWRLDLDAAGKAVDDGIFKFSLYTGILYPGHFSVVTICFCPSWPGEYTAHVPVFLNAEKTAYRTVRLSGALKPPKITFEPQLLILTPVPLNMRTGADVYIIPHDYLRATSIQVEIPETDFRGDNDSDEENNPLTVNFPKGNIIKVTKEGTNIGFSCRVNFISSKPLSFLKNLFFIDGERNRFSLQVSATTENCLLTVYPYLAYHLTDQQIILRHDSAEIIYSTGATLSLPCNVPGSCSQTSSCTFDTTTDSAYETSVAELEKALKMEKMRKRASFADSGWIGTKCDEFLFPAEGTQEYTFFQKVILAVQSWFSLFGWSKGPNPIFIPHSLRRDVCKIQMTSSDEKLKVNFAKDTMTIYDMLLHLSGQLLPGISSNQSLPFDPIQRVVQLHWQHATMITFLKGQGASLSHVLPEFLLDLEDFRKWSHLQVMVKANTTTPLENYIYFLNDYTFEAISKRTWMDVLLQIYKILVLKRISVHDDAHQNSSGDEECIPRISVEPLSSNIYSSSERIILTWLNRHFEKMRKTVWKDCRKGDVPPTRWILNFDKDLLDGLVLAAQLASYCPYLISTHFVNMHTCPETSEQYFHNALLLVNAFHSINLDTEVLATDICDPNPIMMLMLCAYLYERLPQYLPQNSLEFAGPLHATVVRKVRLKNPSVKPLVYNITILGQDAADFMLPKGNTVTIPSKSQVTIMVKFTSRFLHPAEAVLLLVSKALTGVGGVTMTFSLKTKISQIKPAGTLKCKSPCYELKECSLQVTSPFKIDGPFSVILVESTSCISDPETLNQINQIKQGKIKSTEAGILKNADGVVGLHEFYKEQDSSGTANESNYLQEFFSPTDVMFLEAERSSTLEIHYLPFNMGKRYCVIVLVNDQIGEFVYLVEGTCCLPLPLGLLPMDSPNVLCSKNTLQGQNEMQPVLFLKCCLTKVLQENLKIPIINEAREKALAIVAQQQMSALEYERRKVTGTLESSSVRAAIAIFGLSRVEKDLLQNYPQHSEKNTEFSVEVSMPECFQVPEKIYIPVLSSGRVNSIHPGRKDYLSAEGTEPEGVELPIEFVPKCPGRYPCQILLQSKYDIRLFKVECVVNTDTAEAELEFVTPAYKAVTQDIPITNMSQQDWKLIAIIKGCCFFGPPLIYLAPGETTPYTLMFKPTAECVTKGKLILQNEADGTRHIFLLKGTATKPLALDHIKIDCQVKQITEKVIMVPNFTQNELKYKVSSDLLIVAGDPTLTVEPGDTTAYTLNIAPWKRGEFKGIIVFVAEDSEQQQNNLLQKADGLQNSQKLPTEELETLDAAVTGQTCCKVWFSLEIRSTPAPPVKVLNVKCTVLESTIIRIPVTNPTNDVLPLDVVLIDSAVLIGESKLVLQPKETFHYEVKYSPAVTGCSDGSVIFLSEKSGEFWYALKLNALKPQPTRMPEVECELGKWVCQNIPLINPTSEILELKPSNNNQAHFSLEIDPKVCFIVAPHSAAEISVQFCPSSLGRTDHTARITFTCPQLKEWVFFLSGVGVIPQPIEPASVSSRLGHHSSIIINFKNPSLEDIVVDVFLTDQEHVTHHSNTSVFHHSSKDSIFWLPLKQKQGIFLPSRSKLDIPVLFAPYSMKLYEAVLVVEVKKLDGGCWFYDDTLDLSKVLNRNTIITEDEKIIGLRWIYPIHGIPEAPPYKSAPAIVCCQARSRVEERVEVLLTGVVPGRTSSETIYSSVIPSKSSSICAEVQVTEGFSTTDEFMYDISFESERVKSQLKSAVAINLLNKDQDLKTGIVTLIFNIIFAPFKPLRNPATLVVQRSAGGIWKFPILFIATEPEVDDVINIEAVGLNKESVVSFRLTSQTRHPDPYSAYFLPGGDPDFVVFPQAGELLPLGTSGTCITVGFKPRMYSKKHKTTLVIQTTAMQWMYEINGLPPQSVAPTASAKVDCRNPFMRSATVQQRNFVRENMKLLSTGVSSTIKGAPLVLNAK